MSDLIKSAILLSDENFTLELPFVKVDKEKRLVHGFATADNVDTDFDIITGKASKAAFDSYPGNVREMHQPIAVGTVEKYEPKVVVGPDGSLHEAMYVTVHISKGAEPTWQKVLDGTLKGFSVGGAIKNAQRVYNEKLDKYVRIIDDYDLTELSLVDNPANKIANILTIEKSDTISSDLEKSIVNWCEKDSIISVAKSEETCPICNLEMQNIGFIHEQEPDKEVLKGILNKYKSVEADAGLVAHVDVADATNAVDAIAKSTVPTQEETMADEIEQTVEAVAEDIAKSDSPSEGEADLVKAEQPAVNFAGAIQEMTDLLKSMTTAMRESIESLNKAVTEVKTEVADIRAEITQAADSVEKFDQRVAAVEADTAVKKSGDVGGVTETKPRFEKSKWGGRILGTTEVFSR